MRNFVAATCCLIVGLEILIGVPIAVCLGFLCVGSEFTGTYVVESQVPGPVYSTATYLPPPLPAHPPGLHADPGKPVSAFDPYAASQATPSICPAPTASTACVLPPPLPSASPVVASLPASDPAADQPPVSRVATSSPEAAAGATDPAAAAEHATDAESFLSRFAGPSVFLTMDDVQELTGGGVSTGNDLPLKPFGDNPTDESPESALRASLVATAQLLYRQADRHEANQEYDLADQLRSLARDLRDQASSISRRISENHPEPAADPTEPAATTVTVGPPPLG